MSKIIKRQSLLYIFCEIGYEWPSFGAKALPATITTCTFWLSVGTGVIMASLIGMIALFSYGAIQLLLIVFGLGYLWKEGKQTLPLYFRPFIPPWGSGESCFRVSRRNLPIWPVATTITLALALLFPILGSVLGVLFLVSIVPIVMAACVLILDCTYHNFRDKYCGTVQFESESASSP